MRKSAVENDNATETRRRRNLLDAPREQPDPVVVDAGRVRAFIERFEDGSAVYPHDLKLLAGVVGVLEVAIHDRRAAVVAAIQASLRRRDKPQQLLEAVRPLEPAIADVVLGREDKQAIADGRPSRRHAIAIAARLATIAGVLDCKRCARTHQDFGGPKGRVAKAAEAITKSVKQRAIRRPRRR